LALGVFHCGAQNFDAIEGAADIDWPPAPIASEAYDPQETLDKRACYLLLPNDQIDAIQPAHHACYRSGRSSTLGSDLE
jgi:hypothetical protein